MKNAPVTVLTCFSAVVARMVRFQLSPSFTRHALGVTDLTRKRCRCEEAQARALGREEGVGMRNRTRAVR